jgi:hypothetical protein
MSNLLKMVPVMALSSLVKSYLLLFGEISQSRAGQVLSRFKLTRREELIDRTAMRPERMAHW